MNNLPYHFEHPTAFPPDVVDQIKAIYEVSFPVYERKPFWYVSNAMQQGHYSVFVIRQDHPTTGEIVAFALLAQLRTSQAMYIEYLAVTPTLRSQGIGSLFWRSMVAFLKDAAAPAIVWEVDPPEKAGDDNERRIRFYERLGGQIIEQARHYGMPNYYKGSGTLPLLLMWKPLNTQDAQPTRAELITLITDIYETEYRGQDAIRDEIIANLDKP